MKKKKGKKMKTRMKKVKERYMTETEKIKIVHEI